MDFKRNIFQSSVKMPARYENVADEIPNPNEPDRTLPGHVKTDFHVVHARSPRVGEK